MLRNWSAAFNIELFKIWLQTDYEYNYDFLWVNIFCASVWNHFFWYINIYLSPCDWIENLAYVPCDCYWESFTIVLLLFHYLFTILTLNQKLMFRYGSKTTKYNSIVLCLIHENIFRSHANYYTRRSSGSGLGGFEIHVLMPCISHAMDRGNVPIDICHNVCSLRQCQH